MRTSKSNAKALKPTTKIYIQTLVRAQYQIERAKGSGLTLKQCLELVLRELNFKVVPNAPIQGLKR